jgi:hypothetical protein
MTNESVREIFHFEKTAVLARTSAWGSEAIVVFKEEVVPTRIIVGIGDLV